MADNRFKIKNGLQVESGTTEITGSLRAPSITGSLSGSVTFAVSSSYSLTASFAVSTSPAGESVGSKLYLFNSY